MKSDLELQKAVQEELAFEPAVVATDIGVTAKGGVVTLVGTVASYAEKWAAERAAERVSGMRALAKELVVNLPGSSQRTDAEIAAAALRELEWDVEVSGCNIQVEVELGTLALRGEVEWNYQREAAERDVRKLTGVVCVLNDLTLRPSASPRQVRSKIEAALQRAAMKEARHIVVEASGSKVVLRGEVQSWAERAEAERAAWAAPGVLTVVDEIRVCT